MKLKLRLVTNKPIPSTTDYSWVKDPSVSSLKMEVHTEQIVTAEFKVYPNSNPRLVEDAIRKDIMNEFPNITSIEGLEELRLLKE